MIQWLTENGPKLEAPSVGKATPAQKYSDQSDEGSDDEDDQDLMDKKQLANLKKDKMARSSVSAEAYGKYHQKANFQPKIVSKKPEQMQRIRARLSEAFMFQALEEPELRIVINAMEEKKYGPGEVIIAQGDDGDNLYVVD